MFGRFKVLVTPSCWKVEWIGWGAMASLVIVLLCYSALKERDAGSPLFDTQILSTTDAKAALADWNRRCPGDDRCISKSQYVIYALAWDTAFPIACAVFSLLVLASAWRSFRLPARIQRAEPLIWFTTLTAFTAAVGGDMSENIASTLIFTGLSTHALVWTALVIGNNVKWILWIVLSVFLIAAVARLIAINIGVVFHLRFPIVVLGAGMAASLAVPQVTELYTLADEKGQFLWLWAASLLLAIAVWYTARTTLRYRLPTWHSPHTPLSSTFDDAVLRLKIWVPRILGTSVIAVVAVAYPGNSIILWITAVAFAIFVIFRRPMAGAKKLSVERARGYLELSPWNFTGVSTTAKILLVCVVVINVVIVILTAFNPAFLTRIGAVSIILLAGTFFVITGSLLALLGSWLRIPFIAVLIVFASVMQWYGITDNHFVRQCPEAHSRSEEQARCREGYGAPAVTEQYTEARIRELRGGPVFIVSATGGGIRAAAWTALVLGTIEDHAPLASHMFAGSGVSGGSLGLAVFTASFADGVHGYAGTAREVLDRDFLSPTLTATFFNDTLQRVAPVGLPDRGEALERAWEFAWRRATGTNRFHQPFLDLYNQPSVPFLLLNTASVARGDRVIQHPWEALPDAYFPGADDGVRLSLKSPSPPTPQALPPYSNIPLSAVVHNSARFTYVSPAGSVAGDDGEVYAQWVDGGYFEASGAQSAFDLVEWLVEEHQVLRSDIHVIHISNDVFTPASRDPVRRVGEAMAPIQSILRSRSARGASALASLALATPNFHHFCIAAGGHPLPLGWTLSSRSFDEMDQQLMANAQTFRDVVSVLGGDPDAFPILAAKPGACTP